MIERIHDRRTFEDLYRHGRRARSASLWCRYVDGDLAGPPKVAFAIGRSVGTAVARNRVRRRLRAIASSVVGSSPGTGGAPFERGALLLGATPASVERTFEQLRTEVTAMLGTVLAPDVSVDPGRPVAR